MKSKKYPVSRKDNLVVQEADGEVLIYDLTENKAFCLNETSALIWQLCDGKKSLTEMSIELGKKLNSPASEGLVWLGLEQLKKENLIENEVTVPIDLVGMSRREVIRKVGIGSMIAIPIISSLIAPTAAQAQTTACPDPGNYMDACRCAPGTFPGSCNGTGGGGSQVCPSGPSPNACLCRTLTGVQLLQLLVDKAVLTKLGLVANTNS